MNTRILSAGLFCVALLSSAACATVRPEVSQPLKEAQALTQHQQFLGCEKKIAAAEAVSNQTEEEKTRVAKAKADVAYRRMKEDFPGSLGLAPTALCRRLLCSQQP